MLLARVRVTTANTWIGAWAMFWYLTFQVPMAIVSAAALGYAYAVYATIDTILGSTAADFVVEKAILAAGSISGSFEWISEQLLGVGINPLELFIGSFALIFLLGLLQLILTWFVFTCMRINSLSGEAAGIKNLMFALAGIGYAIPILNLFPLIFLWMIVVWIHPK